MENNQIDENDINVEVGLDDDYNVNYDQPKEIDINDLEKQILDDNEQHVDVLDLPCKLNKANYHLLATKVVDEAKLPGVDSISSLI